MSFSTDIFIFLSTWLLSTITYYTKYSCLKRLQPNQKDIHLNYQIIFKTIIYSVVA